MTLPSKHLGWMSMVDEIVQDISARVASLEHFSNQQSILLDAVLDILEKGMDKSGDRRGII